MLSVEIDSIGAGVHSLFLSQCYFLLFPGVVAGQARIGRPLAQVRVYLNHTKCIYVSPYLARLVN